MGFIAECAIVALWSLEHCCRQLIVRQLAGTEPSAGLAIDSFALLGLGVLSNA